MNNKWHEGYPPQGGHYLVTFRMSIGYPQGRYVDVCAYDSDNHCWIEIGEHGVYEINDNKIVAWMELPKIYEGDCEWADDEEGKV